jgi:K+-sensing histidine kinase KdpD
MQPPWISISDTGPGIPLEIQPVIPEICDRRQQEHGSGLGLAFCKLVVVSDSTSGLTATRAKEQHLLSAWPRREGPQWQW